MNFSSYNATKGVVAGRFSHVQVELSGVRCRAVIDGTSGTAGDGIVKSTYTNRTVRLRALTVGGSLHFYDVSGCAGLLRGGDPVILSAGFAVSPKQAITSP